MSDKPEKLIQLELGIERPTEKDRNFHVGGRSFYFFDFDDNVAHLNTPLYIFHRESGEALKLSTQVWTMFHSTIGKINTPYADYEIRYDDQTGSFRDFRDVSIPEAERLIGKKQSFVQDIEALLNVPDLQWKGPSWNCFYHATFNQRPVGIITARGHQPETIREGIKCYVDQGFLKYEPNYLSIFPVSHIETRHILGDKNLDQSVPWLKKAAIRASVEMAIKQYGYSPHHRFGMSDDDPKNIQLIVEEMKVLKTDYPEFSFFIIETQSGEYVKREISISHYDKMSKIDMTKQSSLF